MNYTLLEMRIQVGNDTAAVSTGLFLDIIVVIILSNLTER